MIQDLFFAVKMLGVTVLVVLLLQLKVGDQTLDERFQTWVKGSFAVALFQDTVDGFIAAGKDGYKEANKKLTTQMYKIKSKRNEDRGDRTLKMPVHRYNEDENGEPIPKAETSTPEIE
jgi:hypothetical protein